MIGRVSVNTSPLTRAVTGTACAAMNGYVNSAWAALLGALIGGLSSFAASAFTAQATNRRDHAARRFEAKSGSYLDVLQYLSTLKQNISRSSEPFKVCRKALRSDDYLAIVVKLEMHVSLQNLEYVTAFETALKNYAKVRRKLLEVEAEILLKEIRRAQNDGNSVDFPSVKLDSEALRRARISANVAQRKLITKIQEDLGLKDAQGSRMWRATEREVHQSLQSVIEGS